MNHDIATPIKSKRVPNIAGQRFGDWVVLGFSKSLRGNSFWICRCQCGKEQEVKGARLRSGKSTGCHSCCCLRAKSPEDLSGKVFGKWTVISMSLRRIRLHVKWLCQCDCGNKREICGSTLKSGGSKGCRECNHKQKERIATSRYWRACMSSASCRGLEFTISKDETFDLLAKQGYRCALTGEPIKIAMSVKEHIAGGTTASLDRIDSSKGYTSDNIQWLHKDVNCMKMDLSQERFIRVCELVVHNQRSGH